MALADGMTLDIIHALGIGPAQNDVNERHPVAACPPASVDPGLAFEKFQVICDDISQSNLQGKAAREVVIFPKVPVVCNLAIPKPRATVLPPALDASVHTRKRVRQDHAFACSERDSMGKVHVFLPSIERQPFIKADLGDGFGQECHITSIETDGVLEDLRIFDDKAGPRGVVADHVLRFIKRYARPDDAVGDQMPAHPCDIRTEGLERMFDRVKRVWSGNIIVIKEGNDAGSVVKRVDPYVALATGAFGAEKDLGLGWNELRLTRAEIRRYVCWIGYNKENSVRRARLSIQRLSDVAKASRATHGNDDDRQLLTRECHDAGSAGLCAP